MFAWPGPVNSGSTSWTLVRKLSLFSFLLAKDVRWNPLSCLLSPSSMSQLFQVRRVECEQRWDTTKLSLGALDRSSGHKKIAVLWVMFIVSFKVCSRTVSFLTNITQQSRSAPSPILQRMRESCRFRQGYVNPSQCQRSKEPTCGAHRYSWTLETTAYRAAVKLQRNTWKSSARTSPR